MFDCTFSSLLDCAQDDAERARAAMRECDQNGDGRISFDEFLDALLSMAEHHDAVSGDDLTKSGRNFKFELQRELSTRSEPIAEGNDEDEDDDEDEKNDDVASVPVVNVHGDDVIDGAEIAAVHAHMQALLAACLAPEPRELSALSARTVTGDALAPVHRHLLQHAGNATARLAEFLARDMCLRVLEAEVCSDASAPTRRTLERLIVLRCAPEERYVAELAFIRIHLDAVPLYVQQGMCVCKHVWVACFLASSSFVDCRAHAQKSRLVSDRWAPSWSHTTCRSALTCARSSRSMRMRRLCVS